MTKAKRLAAQITRLNPGLEAVDGTRHIKLFRGRQLVGVLPHSIRQDGLSPDLVHKLQTRGVVLP